MILLWAGESGSVAQPSGSGLDEVVAGRAVAGGVAGCSGVVEQVAALPQPIG